MTPDEIDRWSADSLAQVRRKVEETGEMRLGATLLATFDPKRGPVRPQSMVVRNLALDVFDHISMTGQAKAAFHETRALATLIFGPMRAPSGLRVVLAYERVGSRKVWSAVWDGGHVLGPFEEGEVGIFLDLVTPPIIHFLNGGHALCGQPGVPCTWPSSHFWISVHEARPGEVNCEGCIKAYARSLG